MTNRQALIFLWSKHKPNQRIAFDKGSVVNLYCPTDCIYCLFNKLHCGDLLLDDEYKGEALPRSTNDEITNARLQELITKLSKINLEQNGLTTISEVSSAVDSFYKGIMSDLIDK